MAKSMYYAKHSSQLSLNVPLNLTTGQREKKWEQQKLCLENWVNNN